MLGEPSLFPGKGTLLDREAANGSWWGLENGVGVGGVSVGIYFRVVGSCRGKACGRGLVCPLTYKWGDV